MANPNAETLSRVHAWCVEQLDRGVADAITLAACVHLVTTRTIDEVHGIVGRFKVDIARCRAAGMPGDPTAAERNLDHVLALVISDGRLTSVRDTALDKLRGILGEIPLDDTVARLGVANALVILGVEWMVSSNGAIATPNAVRQCATDAIQGLRNGIIRRELGDQAAGN